MASENLLAKLRIVPSRAVAFARHYEITQSAGASYIVDSPRGHFLFTVRLTKHMWKQTRGKIS